MPDQTHLRFSASLETSVYSLVQVVIGAGAGTTAELESQAKQLADREAALEQAQSALHTQQQQLTEQVEQQRQRMQQQGEAASSGDATQQLTAQVEELQTKLEDSEQAEGQLREQVAAAEALAKNKHIYANRLKVGNL